MRALLTSSFCIIWLSVAAANTSVIDDSGTLPYNAALALRWQQPGPRSPDANRMVGTLTLRVRLNVTPWLRRSGRIYLALPAQERGTLRARWSTQGRLLPGEVAAGGRTLVYAGPVTTPFIEDTVELTLNVDGRRMAQSHPVSFRFEMDTD